MAIAKGFAIGVSFSLLAILAYAAYVPHPVRCLWCNKAAQHATCLELYYGHTDVIHFQSPDGRLCMYELGEAIRHINENPYRDHDGTSYNDFKRTQGNGSEH
jgi:hypothetical protein